MIFLHETNSNAFKNVLLRVKQIINAEQLYINYFLMACYSAIPFDYNTLKSITIYTHFHTEFTSTYYNDKGDAFRNIFGQYIKPYMNKIYLPALIQE